MRPGSQRITRIIISSDANPCLHAGRGLICPLELNPINEGMVVESHSCSASGSEPFTDIFGDLLRSTTTVAWACTGVGSQTVPHGREGAYILPRIISDVEKSRSLVYIYWVVPLSSCHQSLSLRIEKKATSAFAYSRQLTFERMEKQLQTGSGAELDKTEDLEREV